MTLPPPLSPRTALFLDFDGTLVEIAQTPEGIRVPEGLPDLLRRVAERLDGAVAVVTGRPLSEVDRLLAPLHLPAAGLHGLEHRASIDAPVERVPPPPDLDVLRGRIAAEGLVGDGVMLEDKGLALAVHYRNAPERGPALADRLSEISADLEDLQMLHGKKVIEFKARGHDKGVAAAAFLDEPVFAGRTPVFVGDDVTDEDGFAAARAAGGYGVKVGEGNTGAAHRLADVAAVRAWLEAVVTESAGA